MTFEEPVEFCEAEFYSLAHFKKARFFKDADFNDIKFLSKTNFDQAHFEESACMCRARFEGNVDYSNSRFDGEANFREVQFLDSVQFSGVKFLNEVDFRGTKFLGSLNLIRARFPLMEIPWNSIKNEIVYDGSLYLSLIKNYRNLEWFKDEDDCYYQYRRESQKRKRIFSKKRDGIFLYSMTSYLGCHAVMGFA